MSKKPFDFENLNFFEKVNIIKWSLNKYILYFFCFKGLAYKSIEIE